jgi:hypothetical protein
LVTAAISAISYFSNESKQAQEEYASKTQEAVQASTSLTSEISNLTNKYNELSEEVKTNSSVKDELISTQTELLNKLGLEGQSIDLLIDKYGSLSEAIKQASINQLKDSELDLTAQVNTTRKDLLDTGKIGFFDENQNEILFSSKKHLNEILDVLHKIGLETKIGENVGTGYLTLTGDNSIKGVLKNFNDVKAAMQALSDSGIYSSKQALQSNDLYKELEERYLSLKDAVGNYDSAILVLNNNIAQQQMLTSLQNNEIPKTKEEFDAFKQSLLDNAIASGKFIGSKDQIKAAIENMLSTQPEFIQFFDSATQSSNDATTAINSFSAAISDEDMSKSIDDFQSKFKTIDDALKSLSSGSFDSSSIIDLMQQFSNFDWSAYGIDGTNDDINDLETALKALNIQTLSEAKSAIPELSNAFTKVSENINKSSKSLSDWQKQLTESRSSISNLNSILEEVNAKDYKGLSSDSINKIVSDYPQLLAYLGNEKQLREQITNTISQEDEKAKLAYVNMVAKERSKLEIANNVVNGMIQGNATLVNELGKGYRVDLKNFESVVQTKAKLEEDLIKNSASAWAQYYKVQIDASTGLAKAVQQEGTIAPSNSEGFKNAVNAETSVNTAVGAYNEAITRLNNIVNSVKIDVAGVKDVGTSKKDKGSEKSSQEIDGIERKLDSLNTKYERYRQLAENTNISHKKQNDYLEKAKDILEQEITVQNKSYDLYMKQADSIKLSDSLKKKAQSGSLDITKYSDETANKIKEYQEWYDKAQSVKKSITDIRKEEKELIDQEISNIQNAYDNRKSSIESLISNKESQIGINESAGHSATASDYDYLIEQQVRIKNGLKKEYAEIGNELKSLLSSGDIKKYSDEWFNYQEILSGIKDDILECDSNTQDWKNSIQQISFDEFDKDIDSIDKVTSEIDSLIDETKDGSNEQRVLIETAISNTKEKIDELKDAIADLNAEYANDKYNTIYLDRLDTLQSELDSAEDSVKSYQDKLVDLAKTIKEKENKALDDEYDKYEKIINARKEIIEQDKEQRKQANSVNDKTEDINAKQKRIDELNIAAQTGDRNAEKEKEGLEEELADLKKDLVDEQYDYEAEQQENALDKSLKDYKDEIDTKKAKNEELYENEKLLIESLGSLTESQYKTAIDNIIEYAKENSIELSDTLLSSLNQYSSVSNTSKSSNNSPEKSKPKNINESIAESNKNVANKANITYILENGNGKGTGKSRLNKWSKDNYGSILSYDNMVAIANALGLSGYTKDSVRSESNQDKILAALKKAGFKTGGVIHASDIVSATGEEVAIGANVGEAVITADAVKLLHNINKTASNPAMMNAYSNLAKSASNIANYTTNNNSSPISINIESLLSGVTVNSDYDLINGVKQNLPKITDMITKHINSKH